MFLLAKKITKTYLVRIGQIFCLYSVGGGKNPQNSTERMLHMGRQINHEGINNSMMGTETVEPVTRYDILEGQCGAAIDKISLPEEGEIEKIPTNVLELAKRLQNLQNKQQTIATLCSIIKKSGNNHCNSGQAIDLFGSEISALF